MGATSRNITTKTVIMISIESIIFETSARISKMKTIWLVLLTISLLLQFGFQTPATKPTNAIRQYRIAHEHQILSEFMDLLAIPNVASTRKNIRKNVGRIMDMMKQQGIKPILLEANEPIQPPAI